MGAGVVSMLVGLNVGAALADDGPSKGDAAVALRSARLYIKQQLWDKAQEQLEVAVKGDSMNAEAHFLLGSIHGDRDNIDQMNAHFDLVAGIKPGKYDKDIKAWREKAWTQHYNNGVRALQKDKVEDGLKEFGMAVRADSTRADGFKSLGIAYLRMDKMEEGITAFEKAVAMDPKDKNAFVNLGIAYHNARKSAKELDAFLAAARLDPKNSDIQAKLVMGYETMALEATDSLKAGALYDSAMAACDRALSLDPKNSKVAVSAGRLHMNRAMRLSAADKKGEAAGFYANAEKYLKSAVELDPQDASSVFNLGLCYSQLDRFDEALAAFRKVVETDPKDVDAWLQLGYTQVRQKDIDGAIAAFKKVVEVKPDNVRAYEFLASAYAQKDMPKEAKEAYDMAQALKAQGKE